MSKVKTSSQDLIKSEKLRKANKHFDKVMEDLKPFMQKRVSYIPGTTDNWRLGSDIKPQKRGTGSDESDFQSFDMTQLYSALE